jgi:2-aminoethylphosphonate-pyruvate transaminase
MRDMSHREAEFSELLQRVNHTLVEILGGKGTHSAVLFASSGTGATEAILSGIHGEALVLENGMYSARLADILDRYAIPARRLKLPRLAPMSMPSIEEALSNHPRITHILVVHMETTTGVVAPLRALGELALRCGKRLVVDGISSIGGHPFHLAEDNIAFCSVSPNKCLEGLPGISFVVARDDELAALDGKARGYYFDLYRQWHKERGGTVPFTVAPQIVAAFEVALQRLRDETYAGRVERYRLLAQQMRNGLRRIGFEPTPLPDEIRSNTVTLVELPPDLTFAEIRERLHARGITVVSDEATIAEGRFFVANLGNIGAEDIDWFIKNLGEVAEAIRSGSAGPTAPSAEGPP